MGWERCGDPAIALLMSHGCLNLLLSDGATSLGVSWEMHRLLSPTVSELAVHSG